MKKWVIWTLVLLLVLITAAAVLAQTSDSFDLGWHLLSGGGGTRQSASFRLDDVLGQWADGRTASVARQVDPGYWPAGPADMAQHIFLPVVAHHPTP
jgi:hypothetical protein